MLTSLQLHKESSKKNRIPTVLKTSAHREVLTFLLDFVVGDELFYKEKDYSEVLKTSQTTQYHICIVHEVLPLSVNLVCFSAPWPPACEGLVTHRQAP